MRRLLVLLSGYVESRCVLMCKAKCSLVLEVSEGRVCVDV